MLGAVESAFVCNIRHGRICSRQQHPRMRKPDSGKKLMRRCFNDGFKYPAEMKWAHQAMCRQLL